MLCALVNCGYYILYFMGELSNVSMFSMILSVACMLSLGPSCF